MAQVRSRNAIFRTSTWHPRCTTSTPCRAASNSGALAAVAHSARAVGYEESCVQGEWGKREIVHTLPNEIADLSGVLCIRADLIHNFYAIRRATYEAAPSDYRCKVDEHLDHFLRLKARGARVFYTPEICMIITRASTGPIPRTRWKRSLRRCGTPAVSITRFGKPLVIWSVRDAQSIRESFNAAGWTRAPWERRLERAKAIYEAYEGPKLIIGASEVTNSFRTFGE